MTGTGGEISGKPGAKKNRDGDDFFIDEEWCTRELLRIHPIRGWAWDPACGTDTIGDVVRQHAISCWSTDLRDRGGNLIFDFISGEVPPRSLDYQLSMSNPGTIICNPPFKLAQQFFERALRFDPEEIIMLVQAKFLYSRTRFVMFNRAWRGYRCSAIVHMSDRPSMPPGDEFLAGLVKRGGGKLDYCWVIWSRLWSSSPLTYWIINPAKRERRKKDSLHGKRSAG